MEFDTNILIGCIGVLAGVIGLMFKMLHASLMAQINDLKDDNQKLQRKVEDLHGILLRVASGDKIDLVSTLQGRL